jgi:phosphate transport system substrate-binding protein
MKRKIAFVLAAIICFALFACTKQRNAETRANTDDKWRFVPTEKFESNYFNETEYAPVEQDAEEYRYNYHVLSDYENVSASSALSNSQGHYPAANLVDKTWRSWAEGAKGGGIGESFTLTLHDSFKRRSISMAGFALKNGYGHLDHYSKNNRVKSFKIYIDGKYTETIPIKDSISFEQYAFTEPVVCKTIRFEIDDVYPGTDYDDTCVAEIAVLTEIVSDSIFYDNILIWIGPIGEYSHKQYENNMRGMISISDTDRLLLNDYTPFDIFLGENHWANRKTKVALLKSPSTLRFTDNLPRLDGATAMYPLYSSFVRAVYPEVKIGFFEPGREFISVALLYEWLYFPNTRFLYEEQTFPRDGKKFESIVQCNTTSQAYRRHIDGETDIIFCYEPSQEDRNAVAEKGKNFNLTPIAKDAFVFIVNKNNVLDNITQQQIRDIYSGRVTNCKSISGVDEPVIAYQRRENSGSQTILQSIMKGTRIMRPPLDGESVSGGMFASVRKVTSDFYNYNSAIGYTFLFYLTQMAGRQGVKTLSVDGVAPTRRNIQNNSYPFVQTVYAVTTGNESENAKKFIEWILGPQGQELVEKTGYTTVK